MPAIQKAIIQRAGIAAEKHKPLVGFQRLQQFYVILVRHLVPVLLFSTAPAGLDVGGSA